LGDWEEKRDMIMEAYRSYLSKQKSGKRCRTRVYLVEGGEILPDELEDVIGEEEL